MKDAEVFTIGRNIAQFEWNPFRAPPKAGIPLLEKK